MNSVGDTAPSSGSFQRASSSTPARRRSRRLPHRLEGRRQAAPGNGLAQLAAQAAAPVQPLLAAGVELADLVAARGLGHQHRAIGAAHQFVGRVRIARADGHADAAAQAQPAAVQAQWLHHGLAQPVCQRRSVVFVGQ
jgi:hypothetical protein